jgi:hypothetical protein
MDLAARPDAAAPAGMFPLRAVPRTARAKRSGRAAGAVKIRAGFKRRVDESVFKLPVHDQGSIEAAPE